MVEKLIFILAVLSISARLHITNVKHEDNRDGKAYVCMAINYFMRHNEFDHGHYVVPYGSKYSCYVVENTSEK